jgi:integrase
LELPSSDDPDAYIFPESCKKAQKHTGTLSNEFFELLIDTGLATKRENESTGKGRSAPRPVSPLTFHSLRHSATTFLKAGGASDVVARELIGHSSPEVSRIYTHLDTEDLREAVDAIPDVIRKGRRKK